MSTHDAERAVPVERYEELIDQEDGRIASERLAELDSGRETAVSADEVVQALDR
jgi:hypothetical protein